MEVGWGGWRISFYCVFFSLVPWYLSHAALYFFFFLWAGLSNTHECSENWVWILLGKYPRTRRPGFFPSPNISRRLTKTTKLHEIRLGLRMLHLSLLFSEYTPPSPILLPIPQFIHTPSLICTRLHDKEPTLCVCARSRVMETLVLGWISIIRESFMCYYVLFCALDKIRILSSFSVTTHSLL